MDRSGGELMKTTILLLVLLGFGSLGCFTTTEFSRQLAQDLNAQLDEYIDERRHAVNALNADYRTSYSNLLAQYRSVSEDRLKLERDAQARAMADAILLSWSRNTTFTAVTGELAKARARQIEALDERAAAIAEVRRRYAETYSNLQLDLRKLEAAKRNLADLSQGENARRATFDFLAQLAKAYQNAAKEAESAQ